MINNIELIKPLLNFEKQEDFYMLHVFKRNKDFPEMEQKNHQSVRTIKTYCINSIEYLEKRWEEITHLCEYFKARAYIHVQKQNHKDVSLNLMELLCSRIRNGVHNQTHIFDSVVGQLQTKEKRWIIDIDEKEISPLMLSFIEYDCKPITTINFDNVGIPIGYTIGPKIEAIIPTKKGHHLITKPFDLQEFTKKYPNIDVQKKNPTLLYYPNSLNNE